MTDSHFAAKRTPTTMESGKIGKGCLIGIGAAIVLVILIAMTVSQYNGLIDKRENTKAAWGEIDSQYKRRYDLVPNLVETVKGAADFNKTTLVEVAEARASVGRVQLPSNLPTDPAAMQSYVNAQQQLSGALSRLLVVAEAYPDLKASANFADLQSQLEGTENRIANARSGYLKAARDYNAAISKFPANLIPGFERAVELPTAAEERVTPKVDFHGDAK